MGRNWHYIFLVLAFLMALFPPVDVGAGGMQYAVKFVCLFTPKLSIGNNPCDWPILLSFEACFLTAFTVIAADRRKQQA